MNNRSFYRGNPFPLLALIVISALSFLLYLNVVQGKFVYDDYKIIVENSFIKEWRYLHNIFTKDYFSISGETSYRPLVTITYFIDYAIWHLNPSGFHLTSVILNTVNTVLFYLLLRTVLQNDKVILLSVLFFITHPILIETVNAIGYRGDLLAATFFLVSLIYFMKSDAILYKEKNGKTRFAFYYTASLISYLCALFSKEMAITLPALLIMFAVFSDQKLWPSLVKRFKGIYIGYFAISLFYLIIRFIALNNPAPKTAYQPGGFWVNTFTMIKVAAFYIKLLFFPYNLNADYVVPLVKSPCAGSFILSAILLISIFVILALLCKTRHMFACWIVWFFITILPIMNILPMGNIMAERYLYLPAMGFCVAKGILVYRITDRTLSPRAIPLRRVVQLVLVTATIGGYGFSIIWKNGTWRDELTLWSKTIARSPDSYRAHCNLGLAYEKLGKQAEAINEYNTAIRLDPKNHNAHFALGSLYRTMGMADNAIDAFRRVITLNSNSADAYKNLVFLYLDTKNDRKKSQYYLKELLRIDPSLAQKEDIKQALARIGQ